MNYRKIWEDVNGIIPTDKFGIPYEIHHIDGNHKNNNIENLMCLSITDHFKIHYEQGDHLAALLIATRINTYLDGKYSKEILSEISKRNNKERLESGTHNFLSETHRNNNKKIQKELYVSGKHHFCNGQSSRGKKSHEKRINNWRSLSEEDFFELLKNYNFYIVKKLRSGSMEKVINSIIIQAINARYASNTDKNIFFEKLKGFHNVHETYLFSDEQVKDNRYRRKQRSTKRS